MADISQDGTLITVHGREGLNIPYVRFQKETTGRETQIDISASDIYIEIPAADLRVKLVTNPQDDKGLIIRLTRDDVEKIPIIPSDFAVIDESNADYPDVGWEGKIKRVGYVGAP